ncbi:hypothetical protein HYDPIDRAFT_169927 [Hydnomerulius pinastri MD-312]|uniref:Uncharacterized protein n=1 Tax=Hydnomerulius pinastri MD-312 TaxID=994086 RepID=A0A0C9V608_9AGAM|nr:hypothetical protein HYDPIDRAFT_169927 [Hydnomerulius pinastri MD-312]
MTATRTTRRSTLGQTLMTEEIVSMDQYKVKDRTSGAAFLATSLLSLVGEPFTLEHLAATLFHITQIDKVPRQAKEAIQAVAFLLEGEVTSHTATAVISHISESVTKEVTQHVVGAISLQMAKILQASESLNSNIKGFEQLQAAVTACPEIDGLGASVERAEEAADAVLSSLEDVKNTIALLTPSLDATQNRINEVLAQRPGNTSSSEPPTQRPSYSNAVKSYTTTGGLPTPATVALARAAIRERQLLLDPQQGHSLHLPDQPTVEIAENGVTHQLQKSRLSHV